MFNGSWKTTSAGILSVISGIVRLVFAFKAGNISEEAITTSTGTILLGLGLIFARDNDKSTEQVQAAKAKEPNISGPLAILILFAAVGAFLFMGCARLQPGADPIVVRTEQALTVAQGSFQLVLRTDELDRGFWRTNAPGFHNFAESLRVPTPYQVTNTLPRWRVYLLSVNDVKHDYKRGRAASNALAAAVIGLESLQTQSANWLNIVTNRPN